MSVWSLIKCWFSAFQHSLVKAEVQFLEISAKLIPTPAWAAAWYQKELSMCTFSYKIRAGCQAFCGARCVWFFLHTDLSTGKVLKVPALFSFSLFSPSSPLRLIESQVFSKSSLLCSIQLNFPSHSSASRQFTRFSKNVWLKGKTWSSILIIFSHPMDNSDEKLRIKSQNWEMKKKQGVRAHAVKKK